MSAALKVPTIFTAVDKFSAPLGVMGSAAHSFANKLESGVNRADAASRRLLPSLGGVGRQLLSFAGTAAIAGTLLGTGAFAFNGLKDYETQVHRLAAVTGTSGKDLDIFKSKIREVATETKQSAVDVATAFTAIGNNQPQLLRDADGLAAVARASITLAKASDMELGPAGEALTTIMNQYSISAAGANKTIDQLAAASQAGSAEIRDVAASLQKFAPVAVTAGIKINEALALIETGSKFFKDGPETGTKFLNILTTMASLKVQDPKALKDLSRLGVNMNVVTDKTTPLINRLQELKKIGKDVPALFHVFGKENLAMASSILNSTDRYQELITKIDATGKAQEMANKNTDTFVQKWEQLKNKFITWLVTSEQAEKSLTMLKNGAVFLADNLTTILSVVGYLTGAYLTWKTAMLVTRGAILATNIALGVNLAFSQTSAAVISTNVAAQRAYIITTKASTAAMWLFNGALNANPIGALVLALVAAGAATYAFYRLLNQATTAERVANQVRERALENTIDQRTEVAVLFTQIRRLEAGTSAYSEVLKKIETLQPGITAQYNLQAGAVDNINRAESELIKTIMKRAQTEARAELIREKTKALLQAESSGPSFMDYVKSTVTPGQSFAGANIAKAERLGEMGKEIKVLVDDQAREQAPAAPVLNQRSSENDVLMKHIVSQQGNITVDFKNLPQGASVTGDRESIGSVIPALSSTMSR